MNEQFENEQRRQFSQITNELKSIHAVLEELKKEITMIKKNINQDFLLEQMKNEIERTADATTSNPSNKPDNQQSELKQDSFKDFRNFLSNANSLIVASNDERTKPPLNFHHGKTTIIRSEVKRKSDHSNKKKLDHKNEIVHENKQMKRTIDPVIEIDKNSHYKKESSSHSTSERTPSRKKNNDNKFSQLFRRK